MIWQYLRRNTDSEGLIVINQTTNPAFSEWVRSLADELGMIALWSGNPPDDLKGRVSIRRGPIYDRSSTLSRLWSWGMFTLRVGWWLLGSVPRRRSVFFVTNPPFMPLLAWVLWRLQKRPYALLEWDIYPHILTPMGLAKPRNPLYRLWEAWHRRALQEAGLVITISEQMAVTLRRLAGNELLPIQIIPNWVDTDWIRPLPRAKNPFVLEHDLDLHLTVMYSGNLGTTHAIETILSVAEALQDRSDIQILIIGEGSKRQLVEEAIASGKLPHVRLLPRQPLEWLPYALASADIGIVTLAAGYEDLSMPSKIYNLLAAGNAILGISQPPNDLALTIKRHNCGANFSPDDVYGIANWLRLLAENRSKLDRYRKSARQAAEQCYNRNDCETMTTAAILNWLDKK